jgi:hypothetical protein
MQRFFRASNAATYEAVRSALDAENGYPSNEAQTTIEPAATAPRDASGRLLLAIYADLVSASLGQLEEIDAATYEASIVRPQID